MFFCGKSKGEVRDCGLDEDQATQHQELQKHKTNRYEQYP
jgi:hypothetical protein